MFKKCNKNQQNKSAELDVSLTIRKYMLNVNESQNIKIISDSCPKLTELSKHCSVIPISRS